MRRWISRTVHRLSGTTVKLIFLAGGFLVLWGMLAPVTTIVWWLNQTAESLGLEQEDEEKPDVLLQSAAVSPVSKIDCYLVFLPGVGNFSSDEITEGERQFVDQLAARHSNCVAVRDVFPYSVANLGLDEGFSSAVWQTAKDSESLAYALIQIRNLWRFAISADDRYGPVYNLSIAHTIVDRMNAAHRIARSDRPINLILLSTSGGTQVALGAAPHLNHWINARVTVVSIGGDFDGRAGFNEVDHVYHLWGDRDWITQLPRVVFPARWRIVSGSPVNQARQQERYTVCNIGDQEHSGSEGYFGDAIAFNQTSHLQHTIDQVNQLPIWSIDQPLTANCPAQTGSLTAQPN
ncbi:MAG: hypothetical protein MUC48_02700 [Leptolyngbya sp. Prado105]|jgi:hypothetical protein|nr:hypothetical protein [Leptolyngbya sp. Prado105]